MIDIDVHKDWGSFTLDVKLHHEGGILGLLGASGCGKSKTLQCIAGIEKPDAGKVVVGVRTLFDSGRHINVPVPQRRVGYLFQHYALFPNMTVEDNIRCGVRSASSKADACRQVRSMMERLNLTGLEKQKPAELSGGQQQRVALARALAVNPRVLLLDEPLSALDAKVRVQLRDEIRRIQLEAGTTTVFVTHDQEEALAVADRIGVMNHGRIEQIADPQTLYRRPGTEYVATFIGLTNRLPGIANGEEAVVFGQRVPLLDGSATDASTVLVRPENMTIELTDDADAVHGAGELGRVEMVHFLGALARVDVRVACAGMGGTIRVTVQLPANELPAGLAIGAQVVVAPRPIPALAV